MTTEKVYLSYDTSARTMDVVLDVDGMSENISFNAKKHAAHVNNEASTGG